MKQRIFKITAALLALGIILTLLLLPVMHMHVKVAVSTVEIDFEPTVNAKWIYNFAKNKETGNTTLDSFLKDNMASGKAWENLAPIRGKLVIFAAATALCVLISLAMITLAFVLEQKKGRQWLLALSAVGLFSAMTSSAAFSSIAAALLNGGVKLSSLLGLGALSGLVDNFIDLQDLSMGSAIPWMMGLFTLLLVFVLAFMGLDLLDERDTKKKKKAAGNKNAKR